MSRPKRFPLIAAVSAAGLLAAATAADAANILLNPSFENPVTTGDGNHVGTAATSWTAQTGASGAGPAGTAANFNVVRSSTGAAHSGVQFVDLTGTAPVLGTGVTQQFTIGAAAPTLTFGAWFSPRDGANNVGGTASIYDATNTTLVATAPRVQNALATDTSWKLSTATFSLPAGTYTFRAAFDDAANVDDAFVDPVPEPASLGLLGVGAVGLLARRRR